MCVFQPFDLLTFLSFFLFFLFGRKLYGPKHMKLLLLKPVYISSLTSVISAFYYLYYLAQDLDFSQKLRMKNSGTLIEEKAGQPQADHEEREKFNGVLSARKRVYLSTVSIIMNIMLSLILTRT